MWALYKRQQGLTEELSEEDVNNFNERISADKLIIDLEDNYLEVDSQEADHRIRDKFATHFQEKDKVEAFLIDKCLDKAIKRLPISSIKKFIKIREEIETYAVALRLANSKGWRTALQIVGKETDMAKEFFKKTIETVEQVQYLNRQDFLDLIRIKFSRLANQIMGLETLPSKVDTLVSFIVWLDLKYFFSNCADVLAAVLKEHLKVQLLDSTKDYKVKKLF
ncbi:23570_t:CDS:2 [Cetraspora pellucida]|uniref:23570_t:CDS:1 n=1 Tax=Cetraspora pellucida TaxID=1433469 RepID=A0A9N9HL27_9GLOM|nr:23570_t:CDS:2 [Cetraspora pellucida]